MAFTSPGLSFAALTTLRTEPTVAFHQSSGSCSLQSGQDLARRVDRQGFRAGSADVDAEKDAHGEWVVGGCVVGDGSMERPIVTSAGAGVKSAAKSDRRTAKSFVVPASAGPDTAASA
jgi:hypothetical protein